MDITLVLGDNSWKFHDGNIVKKVWWTDRQTDRQKIPFIELLGCDLVAAKNALFMPRLTICSRDLHWQWINWTLLCDTMEVSMLCLAWLPIAQQLISQKNCFLLSPTNWVQGVTTISKNIALLGAKKWGPTCDRNISNSAIYTTAIYREYTVFWHISNTSLRIL